MWSAGARANSREKESRDLAGLLERKLLLELEEPLCTESDDGRPDLVCRVVTHGVVDRLFPSPLAFLADHIRKVLRLFSRKTTQTVHLRGQLERHGLELQIRRRVRFRNGVVQPNLLRNIG